MGLAARVFLIAGLLAGCSARDAIWRHARKLPAARLAGSHVALQIEDLREDAGPATFYVPEPEVLWRGKEQDLSIALTDDHVSLLGERLQQVLDGTPGAWTARIKVLDARGGWQASSWDVQGRARVQLELELIDPTGDSRGVTEGMSVGRDPYFGVGEIELRRLFQRVLVDALDIALSSHLVSTP